MKRSNRRGFTLAEVLVTVTITAVLAAVVVPSVVNQVKKGDKPSLTSEMQAIGTAIGQYANDTRAMPSTLGDLVSAPTSVASVWRGPYLSTGQDLSTTSSTYTAAAYNLTYSNDLTAGTCSPSGSFVPVQVTAISGTPIATVPLTNTTFKQLYSDMDDSTTTPQGNVTAGPVQFTITSGNLTTMTICMITGKVQ